MIHALRPPLIAGFALLAFLLGASLPGFAASERAPIVVELFTSQGCSSCPEADALLAELAQREDIIVLSYHVSYWDYIGWEDPFASEETTQRQRDYALQFGISYVYTPQMVVAGAVEVVGSDRAAIEQALIDARETDIYPVAPEITHDAAEGLRISIPGADLDAEAQILLVVFDSEQVTEVSAGENAGRELRNVNIVRTIRRIGSWHGEPVEIILPLADLHSGPGSRDGCAIIVQLKDSGRILGGHALLLGDE
ncbi:MAG: DUF1223 domain-containing protein [Alphaproteobacteria bacterium]